MAAAGQFVVDSLQWFRKLCLQQDVEVLPNGVLARPAVEPLGSPIPVEYAALDVADDDAIS